MQLFGRHATWREQGLYHVGGRHTTWQEQDLAQGGGRHCHLAGTGLGSCWWQAQYLARTGAWFMLVAATTTWQEHDLAHVGGRHNTLLVKGYTAEFNL